MDVAQSDQRPGTLSHFFFAREIPYGLAIIRILLPLVLLCVVIPRWPHARELFSTDGAPAPLALNYGYENFPPAPTGAGAVVMMTALAVFLTAASAGWHTRIALIGSWGLFTYLNMLDCLSTFTKYSVISSHILLLLSVSDCGAIWSVDRWRLERNSMPGEATLAPARSPAWPRRLIQLLIGLIYFGASFTKMHTDGFMSGDQIRYWLITNLNNSNPLGELLAMYPEVIVTMSHIAVIWQVLFLFLSWRGTSRLLVLGIGAMFHLSTIWLLGLFIFPPVMIITYFAWLNEEDVDRLRHYSQKFDLKHRLAGIKSAADTICSPARHLPASPISSILIFCGVLSAAVLGGLELEHAVDPYGRRQAGGPTALQPMSQEDVDRMLRRDASIREADKFFAMELGTDTLGGVVVGRGTTYQPGDRMIVQCALIPPHEDLMLACCLNDENGVELDRVEQPVPRSVLRADFVFTFPPDMKPGKYQFTARSDDKEVLARTVQIESRSSSVFGN